MVKCVIPKGLTPVTNRDEATNGPILDEISEEEIKYVQQDVRVFFNDDQAGGNVGALYVTTRRVFWLSDTDAPNGFSITFHNIAMHAISRDPESFPHSCIYMQIDTGELYESDEEEEEEGQEIITELRIVPSTDESLETVFQALCDCAALNPDPEVEGDDAEGDFFFDEDEIHEGAEGDEREEMLNRFDEMLQISPDMENVHELVLDDPERYEDEEEA
eukprot:CAMPEP_0198209434 /NCGR_PEP_ID=MMETSP1445-20131203/15818_1 /TAXON_ID=36898 /ORGANISM="Pyramimonas sp., Strain CCMP2087" /LENGTH=217 /DNA_ID=CAMNT_0043883205 /DNA_START=119 /DNA_END=772 /DNA_ORIENTATION=+